MRRVPEAGNYKPVSGFPPGEPVIEREDPADWRDTRRVLDALPHVWDQLDAAYEAVAGPDADPTCEDVAALVAVVRRLERAGAKFAPSFLLTLREAQDSLKGTWADSDEDGSDGDDREPEDEGSDDDWSANDQPVHLDGSGCLETGPVIRREPARKTVGQTEAERRGEDTDVTAAAIISPRTVADIITRKLREIPPDELDLSQLRDSEEPDEYEPGEHPIPKRPPAPPTPEPADPRPPRGAVVYMGEPYLTGGAVTRTELDLIDQWLEQNDARTWKHADPKDWYQPPPPAVRDALDRLVLGGAK